MNMELSFLVEGDMFKAVMQKEKSCTQLEKTELVTIKLFEQDRSILLKSFTVDNGKAELRCSLMYKNVKFIFFKTFIVAQVRTYRRILS